MSAGTSAAGQARSASTSAASGAGGSSGSASTSAASGAGGLSGASPPSATAGASGSTGSATTLAPFIPLKPKFGGLKKVDAKRWSAWTGGKPKADWTGLEDPDPQSINVTQYRSTSMTSEAKGLKYQIGGLENKLTQTGDLQTFQKKVMKHLVAYGLDTVTYVPNPSSSTEVVSIINQHGLYTLKDGSALGNRIKEREFDSYCHDNDRDAKDFVLNSVDEELESQLYQDCQEEDSFVAMWLTLIHIVRLVSINRFDAIKERIRSRKISDYPGENVETILTDFLTDYKDLHSAQMYNQNLTLTMLTAIMEAGGTANEDFKYPLREIQKNLKQKLLEIRHMSYTQAHEAMVLAELDVPSMLKQVKLEYRSQHDEGNWPAALITTDGKAVDKNFGRVNKAEIKSIVSALVQSTGAPGKDKSSTWTKVKGKRHNSSNKSARNNPNQKGSKQSDTRPKGKQSNRTPPPKNGESEIKFIDGKKKYWCATCNCWTLSHGTDGHKTKEELKAERPTAGMARVDFDLHPSAFQATASSKYLISLSLISLLKFIMGLVTLSCVAWLYITAIAFGASTIQGYGWPTLQPLLAKAMTMVKQEWIFLFLLTLSGSIGFGTAATLYSSAKPEGHPTPVQLRCGVAAQKQARRWNKAQNQAQLRKSFSPRQGSGQRSVPCPGYKIPPPLIRANLQQHPRFNNLGQPKWREPPKVHRIRYIKARTCQLALEIGKYQRWIDAKRAEYKRLVDELKYLQSLPILPPRGPSRANNKNRNRKRKNQFTHSRSVRTTTCALANVKVGSRSTSAKPDNFMCPAELKPQVEHEPWCPLRTMRCYILSLVNLSRISSTQVTESRVRLGPV